MITGITVCLCFFVMWVCSKIGKDHDIEKSGREMDNVLRNINHYTEVIRDDSTYWIREGGRRCVNQISKVVDKLNGRS